MQKGDDHLGKRSMVAGIEEGGERNIGVSIICSHYVKTHLHLVPACAVGG
jgi:hypothetical protein